MLGHLRTLRHELGAVVDQAREKQLLPPEGANVDASPESNEVEQSAGFWFREKA